MHVECIGNHWHNITPTGLALVIEAFIAGDLHTVNGKGMQPRCILEAFTDDRVADFNKRYASSSTDYVKLNVKPTTGTELMLNTDPANS